MMRAVQAFEALARPSGRTGKKGLQSWVLPHPRLLLYVLAATAMAIGTIIASRPPQTPHPSWLIVVEAATGALALATGAIGLAYFRGFGARSLLFVSLGFLGAGVMQAIHLTLLFEVLPLISNDGRHSAEIASKLAGQAYLGIMLLAGWHAREWRIAPISQQAASTQTVVLLSGLALLGAASITVLVAKGAPPTAAPSLLWAGNLAICLLYLVSLISFLAAGDWREHIFQHGFLLGLLLICGSHVVSAVDGAVLSESVRLTAEVLRCLGYAVAFVTLLVSTSPLLDQVSELRLNARIKSLLENQEAVEALGGGPAQAISITHQMQGVGTFELDLDRGRFRGSRVTASLFGSTTGLENLEQFEECLHPQDARNLIHALDHSKRTGKLFRERFRVGTPAGERWLEAVAAIDAGAGTQSRLVGFVSDITAQKALELERDRLHDELEQMVAAVDAHAATAALSPDGTIETTNALFCEVHGQEPEALHGRPLGGLIRAAPGSPSLPRDLHDLETDTTWRGEVLAAAPDGTERVFQASITPRRFSGRNRHSLVYVAFDITDRVMAERALVESVTAHRRSNEDLQMFAHIVSHDLQEPLRMVSSFMTLLDRRYAADLDAEAQEFIQFAVEGAHRMRALLDGLLEYSRVTSRGAAFEPVELARPVAGAIGNLRILIEESGAEIKLGSLPEVRADGAQMVQLFQNLLANSIKFCSGRTPRIVIEGHREGTTSIVTVSDNGIGIEPAHYDRVFQIFQRLHGRGEYPGTGVGLAVCKRIMERHGGAIELESIVGEGTVFRLEFPAA